MSTETPKFIDASAYITKTAEELLYYFPTKNKEWMWFGIPYHLNQDGNVKHYTARMVDHYIKEGTLKEGSIVVCSTSGNTGFAFVKNCIKNKIIPIAIVDDHAPSAKLNKMKSYGGLVIPYNSNYQNLDQQLLQDIKRTEFLLQKKDLFPKKAVQNLIKEIGNPLNNSAFCDLKSNEHLVHIRRQITEKLVEKFKGFGFSAIVLEQYDDVENTNTFMDYGYKIAEKLRIPVDVFASSRGTGSSSSGIFLGLKKYYDEQKIKGLKFASIEVEQGSIISGPGYPKNVKQPLNRRVKADYKIEVSDKKFINLRMMMQARCEPFGDSTDVVRAGLIDIEEAMKNIDKPKKIGLFPISDLVDDYGNTSASIEFLHKHNLFEDEEIIKKYHEFFSDNAKIFKLGEVEF
jgi:cysteine synthase